ncbi:MOSC domain-containing protein [Gorillibacterium massiliense]|uniref:MOSC domain-containing protein n=1 Tax=Gorillibacterium massiliense TaxID=1280390 RepID=UPI0004ACA332|nr:MOSC N-terminal beta barrel domain-containing protein [Gorillibacterium massiliense]
MQITVGEISEIYRYPVKSMAGERLKACDIAPYGMVGDRFGSFYDETKSGWYRYITARKLPQMLKYKAHFDDEGIQVTSPDGRSFGWDEQLLAEVQSLTDTPITMSSLGQEHPEHPQLLSVDGASILLVTDATLKRLESLWGKPLDQRRFRANFLVVLNDDAPLEGDWIGKRIVIGGVQLQVDSFCQRCVIITMDPDTQEKDPSLLKIVNEKMGLSFGVYASVIEPGEIHLGDKVFLINDIND